ncbi:GntR family transcriptional regulator [Aurantimonas sp. A2-1-M11]|uniref:GntR family transcriptional regulator n=1 Tax=Aurantimonas sp. A2-1-M11 TaxID=3113712 RepID=UPI002F95BAA0
MSSHSDKLFFDAFPGPANAPRGVAKYEILRQSIAGAIESGQLPPGTRLPAELTLAAGTNFSLGTVQRALRELTADGYILRRQGRGTFVANRRERMDEPLHSRFALPNSRDFLPVYTRLFDRAVETEAGPWTEVLGTDSMGILRLDRHVDIAGRFRIATFTYMQMSLFSAFMQMSPQDIDGRNLKRMVLELFGLTVLRVEQWMRVAPMPSDAAEVSGCLAGENGMEIRAVAYMSGGRPMYYQILWVPPTEEALYLELAVGN